MQRVIFDSSFLMAVAERPTTWFEDMVDLVGGFQPVLLTCVKGELEQLASGGGTRSRTARVALDLTSKFASEPCGAARVDDEIVSAARTSGSLAATVDSELLASLRVAHVRAVSLSGGRVRLA